MRTNFFILLVFLAVVLLANGTVSVQAATPSSEAPEIAWQKLLGGSIDDRGFSVQQTTDGGYILFGSSSSSASGDIAGANHGSSDYWVVKLDGAGAIQWEKLLGGSGYEMGYSVQQTADGGYILLGTSDSSASGDVTGTNHGSTDYWVVKLDGAGAIQWEKLLGGSGIDGSLTYWFEVSFYGFGVSIQQTADGGYILLGSSDSSASGDVTGTNHGNYDYWVVKLDSVGAIQWEKQLGGSDWENGISVQQTDDGGYILLGTSSSSANGNVTGTNRGYSDYWVVKLDNEGVIQWEKLLGGSWFDEGISVQQTDDGGYILLGESGSSASGDMTGTSHGRTDLWVVKLDGAGAIQWEKLLGGTMDDEGRFVQQTSDGGYILLGESRSSASGDISGTNHGTSSPDLWVVQLDGAGAIQWEKLLGGGSYEEGGSIQQTSDGGFVLLGDSWSSASGDVTGTNHASGYHDFWVVKLAPTQRSLRAVSSSPHDGETGVHTGSSITITFDQSIKPGPSFHSVSLVKSPVGTAVPIDVGIEGNDLVLVPKTRLDGNTSYSVTIPAAAVNATLGNFSLETPYSFEFTTGFSVESFTQTNVTETISARSGSVSGGSVTGDLSGTVAFPNLQTVTVASGAFAGQGSINGSWTATLDGRARSGTWEGTIVPENGRLRMRGTVLGQGERGTVDGFLNETVPGSGIYNQYHATWTLDRLGGTATFASLTVEGTASYGDSTSYPGTPLRITQELLAGTVAGDYHEPINAMVTLVRIMAPANPYYGSGFMYVSYASTNGQGQGWAAVRGTPSSLVQVRALFTSPFAGFASGTLDECESPPSLAFSVERPDKYLPAAPRLSAKILGPERVSPGQTFDLVLEYENTGLAAAEDVEVVFSPSFLVDYLSASENGEYVPGHVVRYTIGTLAPGERGTVFYKGQARWGLAQGLQAAHRVYIHEKDGVSTSLTNRAIEKSITRQPASASLDGAFLQAEEMRWWDWAQHIYEIIVENAAPEGVGEGLGVGELAAPIWVNALKDKLRAEFNANPTENGLAYLNEVLALIDGCAINPNYITYLIQMDPTNYPPGSTFGSIVNALREKYDIVPPQPDWLNHFVVASDPNIKTGPAGRVSAGQPLDYRIEFENVGDGIAYGVYFTDVLDEDLDTSTLSISPVYSTSNNQIIAASGSFDPETRTITWPVGEVGSKMGGYANISARIRADAPYDTAIINYGTVYFPSVPETTRTNGLVAVVGYNRPPVIEPFSNRTVNATVPLEFTVNATDPDGDALTYRATFQNGTPLPNGATIDPATGRFRWTPTTAQTGKYPLVFTVADFRTQSARNVTITVMGSQGNVPIALPGAGGLPKDLNDDHLFEDVNGNGRKDFADVVLYFNQMTWIAANEPVMAFDYNGNGRIDFADVVWLFNHL